MTRRPVRMTLRTLMLVVAAVGLALGASRLSERQLLSACELAVVGLIGLSPILICYLWLRESPKSKSSIPIETLLLRVAGMLAVAVVLWAVLLLLVDPFQ